MSGITYQYVREELEIIFKKISILNTRAAVECKQFETDAFVELETTALQENLARQEQPYINYVSTLELHVQTAQAELRHLSDFVAKRDLGDEVSKASESVRNLIKRAIDYASRPYPSAEYLQSIRTASSELKAREIKADATSLSIHTSLSLWSKETDRLETSTMQKIADLRQADSDMPLHLRESLIGLAESIQKSLYEPRKNFFVVQERWQRLADHARGAAHSFRIIADAAEQRDSFIHHLASEANSALDQLTETVGTADRNMKYLLLHLRSESLLDGSGKSAGLPVVGLRPIVSIYDIKPPPMLPSTFYEPSKRQSLFAHAFLQISNSRPAIQLLHLFHPFSGIDRLVVLGDHFTELCRAVALCASSHVRADRKVTVFVPSAGALELFDRVRYNELFDVNLQQLVTGLGKKLSGDRKELQMLRAKYDIQVVQRSRHNRKPIINESHFYLAVQPSDLPEITTTSTEVLENRGGMTMITLIEAAPHGAPDEALRTLGLRKSKVPSLSISDELRTEYSRALTVFVVPPQQFKRNPSVRAVSVDVSSERARQLRAAAMSAKNAEDFIDRLIPIKNAKMEQLSVDTELARIAPVLLLLANLVSENERTINGVGGVVGVYCGCDLEGLGHFTQQITNIFRALFDYSDPFAKSKHAYRDKRAVAACSSTSEWERLEELKKQGGDEIRILVFGKVGSDPAFDAVVRGKIAILHLLLPMSDAEQARVIRRFLPASVLVYGWDKVVHDKLAGLLPGPIDLTKEIVQIALQVALNSGKKIH